MGTTQRAVPGLAITLRSLSSGSQRLAMIHEHPFEHRIVSMISNGVLTCVHAVSLEGSQRRIAFASHSCARCYSSPWLERCVGEPWAAAERLPASTRPAAAALAHPPLLCSRSLAAVCSVCAAEAEIDFHQARVVRADGFLLHRAKEPDEDTTVRRSNDAMLTHTAPQAALELWRCKRAGSLRIVARARCAQSAVDSSVCVALSSLSLLAANWCFASMIPSSKNTCCSKNQR